MPRKSSWWKKAILLLGGAVVGLLLAEAGLRVLGISYPLPYTTDEHCGVRLKPGFRGRWMKEGGSTFAVNSAGFRDREHALEKPPGVFRVAVLGDSFVEALQVPLEKTLFAVIERQLLQCDVLDGRTVEVLSFGVSGYGTAQELLALQHHAAAYDPDVVVLAFFPGNDVRNNSQALEPQKTRPFYSLEDGKLVLDDSFRQEADYLHAQKPLTRWKVALINSSRLLQWVNELRNRPRAAHKNGEEDEQPGVNDLVYAPPRDETWREAWRITERLIAEINDQAAARDARFLLAVVSGDLQVDPDPARREALAQRLQVEDLFYPNRRLVELGESEGFPVVDLAPPLREYAEEHDEQLHGFANTPPGAGHWNEAGHRLAGELIAAAICRELGAAGAAPANE